IFFLRTAGRRLVGARVLGRQSSRLAFVEKKETMNDQEKFYLAKLEYEIDPYDLHEALRSGERIVVVDSRARQVYEQAHIPGALSIPHRTMTQATTADLDRNALVVVYCDGIGCNGSTKAALNLVRLGFRVKELIGGMEWWQRDGYEVHGTGAHAGLITGR